jgi:uncharacterized RDD family membrane protein YckC
MLEKTKAPSLLKLGACLFYEGLVLIALLFVSAWLYVWVVGDATEGVKRLLMQLYLWVVVGAYFIDSWMKKGQTLPMRSWKLQVIDLTTNNYQLTFKRALIRYPLASLGFLLFGLGFFWALFDRDNQFLHDRLLKTKIIDTTTP